MTDSSNMFCIDRHTQSPDLLSHLKAEKQSREAQQLYQFLPISENNIHQVKSLHVCETQTTTVGLSVFVVGSLNPILSTLKNTKQNKTQKQKRMNYFQLSMVIHFINHY